jgi:hypothetical protein
MVRQHDAFSDDAHDEQRSPLFAAVGTVDVVILN